MRRMFNTMRLSRISGAAVMVAVLGACSGTPTAAPSQGGPGTDAQPTASAAPPQSGDSGGAAPTTPSTAARRSATAVQRSEGQPVPGDQRRPTKPDHINLAEPAEDGPPPDYETRMRIPPGSTLVTHGSTQDGSQWRLYARQQENGSACYDIRVETQEGGGGGGGTCAEPDDPPLLVSQSNPPRLVYGLVASNAATTVVVEHSGAPAETFPAVAPGGFQVRFFAGEAGPAPITRVVAYDKDGRQVAEDRDVANMNSI